MQGRVSLGILFLFLSGLMLISAPPVHASAALVADYQMQNSKASSVGTAPALTDIGTTSFGTESVDGTNCTVLQWDAGNGLNLSTTNLISGTYTIVMLVRLDTTTSFRKLIDFKDQSTDPGLYNYGGQLYFYPFTHGTKMLADDRYAQIVITRDGSELVTGYVDGVYMFDYSDTLDYGVPSFLNQLRFFIDDTSTSGEESGGAVARIRIYDDALTANEVAALDRAIPSCGGAAQTTFADNSTAIDYGSWRGIADGAASGGTYRASNQAGAVASLKFRGTSVKWFFVKGPDMGKANVYIDKRKVKTICLYNATTVAGSKNIKRLTNSKHLIEIKPTGETCGGANANVTVDKFTAGANTFEDNTAKLQYDNWHTVNDVNFTDGSYRELAKTGSATLRFHGTMIQVLTRTGWGLITVKIDDNPVESIESLDTSAYLLYGKLYTGLTDADHKIELSYTSSRIAIDGFRGPITLLNAPLNP